MPDGERGASAPFVDVLAADTDHVARLLSDDRRRAIYLYVKQHPEPVTVNGVADEFGMHRNAAKFHLDKLLRGGLLRAEFKRVNGKRGPGAGRPSKLYSATEAEVTFTVPERHYDLLAHLLLRALTSGEDVACVGKRFGTELAVRLRDALEGDDPVDLARQVLERLGFSPHVETDDEGRTWVTTDNCPFGRVAMEAPDGEVCRLDHAIIGGILDAFGVQDADVREHASMRLGSDVCVREVVVGG